MTRLYPQWGFPGGSAGKEFSCNTGDLGLIPGMGRSLEKGKATHPVFWPGELHGLYSPWVAKSQTRLSVFHLHLPPVTASADDGSILAISLPPAPPWSGSQQRHLHVPSSHYPRVMSSAFYSTLCLQLALKFRNAT